MAHSRHPSQKEPAPRPPPPPQEGQQARQVRQQRAARPGAAARAHHQLVDHLQHRHAQRVRLLLVAHLRPQPRPWRSRDVQPLQVQPRRLMGQALFASAESSVSAPARKAQAHTQGNVAWAPFDNLKRCQGLRVKQR